MPDEHETMNRLDLDFSKIKDEKSGKGLVPVIVQDAKTLDVLMVAFADEEAVRLMLNTKKAAFWSRSRQKSWVKGEESGNFMSITQMFVDCDQDTLLILVIPQGDGKACHTRDADGSLRRSCFYREMLGSVGGGVGLVPRIDI